MNLLDIPRLLLLALPVAFICWTISREELFRDFRDWSMRTLGGHPIGHKAAYLISCGYCLTPWIAAPLVYWTDLALFGDTLTGFVLTTLAVAAVSCWYQAKMASAL